MRRRGPRPAFRAKRRGNRRRRDDGANRRQTAAHRFRNAQDVRVEVEVLAREQAAGTAESAGDFIGDEQRAVTAAEVPNPPDDVLSGIRTPRLMLIGSMTNAATS